MTFTYKPQGVCSRMITFDIDDDGYIRNVAFMGGCNGNTQGLSKLAEGMKAEEVVKRLSGVCCGMRGTSCPDQLATAVQQALDEI
ncbi:MAG: TIGR03905 family TSCPD domain-containing protein [Acutalibacteraceae bacterium]|nr:TIGR03905 family TSCPD domain-containing protein [Clostridia bacterium]MEE1144410.1 TIGR03905 family TSCPD domain-containing protein [Acutalibacteraceae bacterium]